VKKPPTPADDPAALHRRIIETIAAIPRGSVASYGQIAARAGAPGRARLVARVLSMADESLRAGLKAPLPWYRVVNAQGRIAIAAGSAGAAEQKRRLQAEGLIFKADRIDMLRYGWGARGQGPLLD